MLRLSPPVDPNNIYAWQQTEQGTQDKLDFRHHNYKEMRKVRPSQPYINSTTSCSLPTINKYLTNKNIAATLNWWCGVIT